MMKDTDEKIHKVRSGWVPRAGTSVPVGLGSVTVQYEYVCQSGSSQNALLGFYGGFLTYD